MSLIQTVFKKDQYSWFICDVNCSREDASMVDGADVILDELYDKLNYLQGAKQDYGLPEVRTVIIPNDDKAVQLVLKRTGHDSNGATYKIIDVRNKNISSLLDKECWLCNVTHKIFGEHPEFIYIATIY